MRNYMALSGYRKVGIILIIVGTLLFLIPIDYKGVTQQWYIPIALEKGIIFWIIGGILLVFGGNKTEN
jgi:hypothetical protein